MPQLVEQALLFAAVAAAIGCTLGLILARSSYDRLHFLGPLGLVAAPLMAAAVVIQQGLSADGIKTMLTALLLLASGPVVSHALGRSFRLQRHGSLSRRRAAAGGPAAEPP